MFSTNKTTQTADTLHSGSTRYFYHPKAWLLITPPSTAIRSTIFTARCVIGGKGSVAIHGPQIPYMIDDRLSSGRRFRFLCTSYQGSNKQRVRSEAVKLRRAPCRDHDWRGWQQKLWLAVATFFLLLCCCPCSPRKNISSPVPPQRFSSGGQTSDSFSR